jgi:hypothetical protein
MLARILTISSFALLVAGGTASADRWRGNGWHGPVREYHTGYYRGGGGYYHGGYAVRREPIFMPRPVIRERYYNYYRRPELVAEAYGPREGYVWVRGQWQWNGGEWIWSPGHYQPVY